MNLSLEITTNEQVLVKKSWETGSIFILFAHLHMNDVQQYFEISEENSVIHVQKTGSKENALFHVTFGDYHTRNLMSHNTVVSANSAVVHITSLPWMPYFHRIWIPLSLALSRCQITRSLPVRTSRRRQFCGSILRTVWDLKENIPSILLSLPLSTIQRMLENLNEQLEVCCQHVGCHLEHVL
jgi:hypothetical protein